VSAQTHGRITELFDPGSINTQTALILANAVYFKGAWQQPFNPAETRSGTFHAANGVGSAASFMFSDTLVAPATKGSGYDAVQLPYKGGRFAALVIMPTAGTLANFVDGLSPASLDRLVSGLRKTAVNLSMPKFQLTDSHNLNSVLQSMGVTDAFANADLSGLSPNSLFVSQVEQRAFLKVSEQGTEAAAVSGVSATSSLRLGQSITIDHPFLFLVRDTTTGAILFDAEVENPNS
jgi:serpin B